MSATVSGVKERIGWLTAQLEKAQAELLKLEREAIAQPALDLGVDLSKPGRAPSAHEEWWEIAEAVRDERLTRHGRRGAKLTRPSIALVNTLVKDAIKHLGLVDRRTSKGLLTAHDQLADLFDLFLDDVPFGTTDRDGTPRQHPWPIRLFLTLGVLDRYAQQAFKSEQGAAAP